MRKIYQYTWMFLLGVTVLLVSCDKNDPLEELGEQVSNKVPFITVAGIGTLYSPDDTIRFNAFYWSVADDITKLALLKEEQVNVVGSITVNDDAGPVTVNIENLLETEMVQEGADLEHDPLDYETARNAYNKSMTYQITPQYQLLEVESADMLASIDDIVYAQDIKAIILEALADNGLGDISWDELNAVTTAVELTIESTLSFRMRVYDGSGAYNESAISTLKIGALE